MTNMSIKCGANGKAKVKYEIDGLTLAACRAKLTTSGLPMTKFIEACMRGYVAKVFTITDGEVHTGSSVTSHEPIKNKPGPKSHKEPERELSSAENAKLPWHDQDPKKRTIMEYNMVKLVPESLDSGETLHLDDTDKDGKTFRSYIEEDWLSERLKIASEADWFDITLWMLIHCWECKFRIEGGSTQRYRHSETCHEIIELNQELTIKHYATIDAKYPEPKEPAQ